MENPSAQGSGDAPDASGDHLSTVRGTAVCAAVGGLLLVAYAVLMSSKPVGCAANDCVGGSIREAGALDMLLLLTGVVLISVAAIGISWMHRPAGSGSKVVRMSAMVAGVSLFTGIVLVGTALFWVGLAALILAILAFAVTGAGMLSSKVLPAWSGAVLVLASVLLLAANDQNQQVLFVIPFGLAWLLLGGLLWAAASASRPASSWHANIRHA